MDSTSVSLLDQLRRTNHPDSWDRLVSLYGPLIQTWLAKFDVQSSDQDDLLQDVLLAVAGDIGQFEHRHAGAFRGWLKQILLNRLKKHWRSRDRRPEARGGSDIDGRLAALEDPTSDVSRIWDRQHDQHVLSHLLAMTEPEFTPTTWDSFCRVALDGEKPASVAQELGISLNAVCLAKSRVLRRLRKEAAGMIESSGEIFSKS
ncbi:MAG: sigma-70 family RNA polymerase sigma factor [Planctomycetota bacterium]